MPIYEYNCEKCGNFEVFQHMSDDPLTNCPQCNSPVRRLISGGVGLIFKGSGFYITDYKRNGNGGSNGQKSSTKKETTTASSNSKATTGESSGGTTKAKE